VKRAILLVDHGSRRDAANQQLLAVAEGLRGRLSDNQTVEIAHMEIAEPSIETAIATCAGAGIEAIAVHPYFLGPGRHIREDIPALVAAAQKNHPHITITIAEPLGLHPGLSDAVLAWVNESS
jgi:sirohydrochlorin ferrochelatase